MWRPMWDLIAKEIEMIDIHIPEPIVRAMLKAMGTVLPGERISHILELKLIEVDKYTVGIRTLADKREVMAEHFEPCRVKVKEGI